MAIIQLNYASQALAVQTNVTILLPEKETQFKTNQSRTLQGTLLTPWINR